MSTVTIIALAACGLYLFSVRRDLASCFRSRVETDAVAQSKQDLTKSKSSLEEDIRSLAWMKLQLKGEIQESELRRDTVRGEIAALEEKWRQARETLDATEFEVVRAAIGVGVATSTSILNMPLALSHEVRSKGAQPRTERLWPDFAEEVRRSGAGFTAQSDRDLAAEVARAFERQCRHLQDVQIDVPALVYPDKDDPDFERKRTNLLEKEHALSDIISDAFRNLQDCLHGVRRQ